MHSPDSTIERQQGLRERVETVALRVEQLERTLAAVTQETAGVRIAGPCTCCERSLLLVREDALSCPVCGYRESL